jgi:hypothetical protein
MPDHRRIGAKGPAGRLWLTVAQRFGAMLDKVPAWPA